MNASLHNRPRARFTRTQLWFFAVLLLAYAALSHYSSSTTAPRDLGVALSIGPIVLISIFLAWRWSGCRLALLGAVLMGAAMWRHWGFLQKHFEAADLIEQCGVYFLIALGFAHSLGSNQIPLCTRIAQELHSPLQPTEIIYYRWVTLAWAVFYLLLTAVIAILYFGATRQVWSLFVNFAAFALIAIAGTADYLLRRWLLPLRTGEGFFASLQRAIIG